MYTKVLYPGYYYFQGADLYTVLESDYVITIGTGHCTVVVSSVIDNELKCEPPRDIPDPLNTTTNQVKERTRLVYVSRLCTDKSLIVIDCH